MKILAADDDAVFLDLLKNHLEEVHNVTFARSAKEALQEANQDSDPFDCFLLDINMPGQDGIELCRLLRKMPSYSATPILMLTALKDTASIDRAFEAGANDYITKPLNGIELRTRINLADILGTQMRKASENAAAAIRLETQLKEKDQFDLEDHIAIEGDASVIDYDVLENILFKLPPAPYAMCIFALKIKDSDVIFRDYGSRNFRNLLSNVAEKIVGHLRSDRFYLTYAGNGVFGCVLIGRGTDKGSGLEAMTGGSTWTVDVHGEGESKLPIQLIKGSHPYRGILSGPSAVQLLAKAVKKANARCREEILQDNLETFRNKVKTVQPRRRIFSRKLSNNTTEPLGRF